jgi:polysaccharide deacetylase 2 family uncharacterized protein YibQ
MLLCILSGALAPSLHAAQLPQISIIIDDMGNQRESGLAAVDLPGSVAYAFLPHTPYAAELAEVAHRHGKEVILHIPMQSHTGRPDAGGERRASLGAARFRRQQSHGKPAYPPA